MSPPAACNLDAYFARLGYTGPREPSLGVLRELQHRHVLAIPFENLDILLGRPIRIDLPSIEQKLIHDRRGGYCFEQNTLFKAALTALGFTVTALTARVRWQVPADVETALTHMILLVEAEGRRHLVDGGFGSGSLSAPLDIDLTTAQPTPHEPRRIIPRRDGLVHQMHLHGEWADLYEFTLHPMLTPDFEAGNWFTSTWPQSRFRQNLIAALTVEGGRRTLLNREFTVRESDGRTQKREIATPEELLEVLARFFSLHFPPGTRFGSTGAPWPA